MIRIRSPLAGSRPAASAFNVATTRRSASSWNRRASSHNSSPSPNSRHNRGVAHSSPITMSLSSRSPNPQQWSRSAWVNANTARYGVPSARVGSVSASRSTTGATTAPSSSAAFMSRRSTCITNWSPTTIVVESPVPTGQKTTPWSGRLVYVMTNSLRPEFREGSRYLISQRIVRHKLLHQIASASSPPVLLLRYDKDHGPEDGGARKKEPRQEADAKELTIFQRRHLRSRSEPTDRCQHFAVTVTQTALQQTGKPSRINRSISTYPAPAKALAEPDSPSSPIRARTVQRLQSTPRAPNRPQWT